MEDRLQYDILKDEDKLTMPILLMVGSDDAVTPYEHQKILFDALPRQDTAQLLTVENAGHTFREGSEALTFMKDELDTWIKELL